MFENKEEQEQEQTFWISYTDLVTGFMMIFLVIAFILISKNQVLETQSSSQITQDTVYIERIDTVIIGKGEKVQGKYFELVDIFRSNFEGQENIQVTDDGTIRFFFGKTRSEILFPENDYHMTSAFKKLLDDFIEIYYGEIKPLFEEQKDSIEIKEIRIEGHTSSTGSYAHNLKLSTLRAYDVANYVQRSNFYTRLNEDLQLFIRENTIAVGYSFTRLLDQNGERVSKTNLKEDPDKSRRVEFRLILEENSTAP